MESKRLDPRKIPNNRTRSEIEKRFGYMVLIDWKSLGYDTRKTALVSGRLYKGWTMDKAMNTPKGNHGGDTRSKHDWKSYPVCKEAVIDRMKKGRTFEEATTIGKNKKKTCN